MPERLFKEVVIGIELVAAAEVPDAAVFGASNEHGDQSSGLQLCGSVQVGTDMACGRHNPRVGTIVIRKVKRSGRRFRIDNVKSLEHETRAKIKTKNAESLAKKGEPQFSPG